MPRLLLLFWWTEELDYKGKRIGSYFAWGYEGQYIVVFPELEIVQDVANIVEME